MKTRKGVLHTGRFEIPYREYGDRDRLFVCVSGALQTMAIWRSIVKRFTEAFTVVVFDMPGIGRSRIKSGGAYVTVNEQLETLHTLITKTDRGGGITLAGSSWGTAIAAAYAALWPDRIQQLVLSSFGMKPNAGMKYLMERANALYREGNYAGGADLIFEVFGGKISMSYKRQIIAQFKDLSGQHAASFYEHCSSILKLGSLNEEFDLTRIKARTLIINGAEDPIIDLQDMYTAQKLIPDCEVRLIEGVGHFLHFEKPELLEEYADFLFPARRRDVEGSHPTVIGLPSTVR